MRQDLEVSTYADTSMLHAIAFAPGTEKIRQHVARRLGRRVQEINAIVASAIELESAATKEISRPYRSANTKRATALVARWIATGDLPTDDSLDKMATVGRQIAGGAGRLSRVIRANLAWRDAVRMVLRDEVGRCGGSEELFLGLCTGLDRSLAANLIRTARHFDRQTLAIEASLAEKERELEYQALHDPLTGLSNRTLLFDRLRHACERLRRHPDLGSLAVIFADVDEFKAVNDRWGHAVGDAVLCEAAGRLIASVRTEDTVARLGGDEFVILCESIPDDDWTVLVTRRIGEALSSPIEIDAICVSVGISIGVSVGRPPLCDADSLICEADRAMYRAKREARLVSR